MSGRILIVDDKPEWREQLVEILSDTGYTAESVATAQDALDTLQQDIYHLLILDIRLEDTDPSNSDGMTLLSSLQESGLNEAIKIIMLSAHGTKEQMRSAFRDFSVADFLSKEDFGHQPLLDSVRKAFEQDVDINMDLKIFWTDPGVEQAIHSLKIDKQPVKQNEALFKRVATELEDLLQRLFSNAESIMVRPLAPTKSRSGTCVLNVQPFYPNGGGQTVVVKFGHFPMIRKEEQHFKDYVRPFVAGARHTTIEKVARTPLLGGIVYSLLGTTNANWVDFGQFYRQNSAQKITSALDRLFHETCGSWYANPGRWLPRNLTEDYCCQLRSSIEQLEEKLKNTLPSIKTSNGQLSFTNLAGNRPFTDPFQAIKGRTFTYPTYESITHGDLNQNNILVDNADGMWLIDFENTERSHILRDVVTLDSVVRFQLLETEDATLDERLKMEDALIGITRFSQLERPPTPLQARNQMLVKAYQITCHLRKLAWWAIGRNPGDDMEEYYVGLLYNALFTLQFFSLSARQREHAFLSASLLADKLTKK